MLNNLIYFSILLGPVDYCTLTMDYQEEQDGEMEALESIYENELEGNTIISQAFTLNNDND